MSLKRTLNCASFLIAAALSWNWPAHGENMIPDEYKTGGFFIGCQAYTFRLYTVFEAIEKTADAGGKVIEFFPGQKLSKEEPNVSFDHNASAETIQKVKDKLAQYHIKAVNYGVVEVKDEDQARKLFEFAKTMGLRAITTESVDAIDTIEKMVKEYDIMVGFHDHPRQPNNASYRMWDPNYVLSVVKDRDPRIGSCADTGHWVRSHLKPVDCLRILKGRIISSHLKDLNEMGLKLTTFLMGRAFLMFRPFSRSSKTRALPATFRSSTNTTGKPPYRRWLSVSDLCVATAPPRAGKPEITQRGGDGSSPFCSRDQQNAGTSRPRPEGDLDSSSGQKKEWPGFYPGPLPTQSKERAAPGDAGTAPLRRT